MKLLHIPGLEQTTKLQHSYKNSTVASLNRYVEFYREQTGHDVSLKDVMEQMVLQFMGDDKVFQKFIKDAAAKEESKPKAKPVAAAPSPAPVAAPATASLPGATPSTSYGTGSSSLRTGD